MSATLVWSIIMLVCFCAELLSGGLYIICFAVGALVAIPFAALDASVAWQIVVFALVSVVSMYTLRPLAKRYLHRTDKENTISNADAILGRIGVVSEAIPTNGYGRLALDGDDWKAVTVNGEALEKGRRARIVERKSLVVTVEPVV